MQERIPFVYLTIVLIIPKCCEVIECIKLVTGIADPHIVKVVVTRLIRTSVYIGGIKLIRI